MSKSKMISHITSKDDWDTQIGNAGDKLVLVDFFATWCGPCKLIAPVLEDLAKEHPDIVFLKVDVDENEDISAENNVTCMPTFILYLKREKVDEVKGADAAKIREMINKWKGQ